MSESLVSKEDLKEQVTEFDSTLINAQVQITNVSAQKSVNSDSSHRMSVMEKHRSIIFPNLSSNNSSGKSASVNVGSGQLSAFKNL
jgi:hypothetical protein